MFSIAAILICAPHWVALTVAGGSVAACLLLLFLLVFPLINKYRGTDFPCRNFKSVKKAGAARKKDEQAADVSWVPTVALPERTGKRPDIKPGSIRTIYRAADKK